MARNLLDWWKQREDRRATLRPGSREPVTALQRLFPVRQGHKRQLGLFQQSSSA